MCVFILSTTFVWNISNSKNWASYDKKTYIGFRLKYPLFLSDFNETSIFPTDVRKILEYQISWISVQWKPSCSTRTDRHDRLVVALHNFMNASKNGLLFKLYWEGKKPKYLEKNLFQYHFLCCQSHMLLGRNGFKCIQFLPHIFPLASSTCECCLQKKTAIFFNYTKHKHTTWVTCSAAERWTWRYKNQPRALKRINKDSTKWTWLVELLNL